jgi:hypothetical protein
LSLPLHYRRAVRRCVSASLLCGWGVAWAAVASAPPDLLGLPWFQIAVGVAIASWGGITATLGRYLAAAYDGKPFFWRAEIVKDGATSVTVGGGAYLGGAYADLGPMLLGMVLLLSGYLGVRILSTAADRLLAVVAQRGGADR